MRWYFPPYWTLCFLHNTGSMHLKCWNCLAWIHCSQSWIWIRQCILPDLLIQSAWAWLILLHPVNPDARFQCLNWRSPWLSGKSGSSRSCQGSCWCSSLLQDLPHLRRLCLFQANHLACMWSCLIWCLDIHLQDLMCMP